MIERFAKPCVGAIIEKTINGEKCILIQTRAKEGGGDTNGLLEIPAGKIREYENIFTALRREVMEETGLTVTVIYGESDAVTAVSGGNTLLSFEPYCVTQNLSGVYSIILNTFLCEADGDLLEASDETIDIHWEPVSQLKRLLESNPERFFLMHLNALRRYLSRSI